MTATMPTTAGHIRKRPFQPSINSYFASRDNAPSSSAPERARSPMSPPLPEDTQASLLSVGMRVRKSVPEGYKTHKTMGVEELPFPSTAPAKPAGGQKMYSNMAGKELTPFCGLHKTGGWGAQEPSSSAPADLGDEDEMPDLTMSQYTLPSTQGSFGANEKAFRSNRRKRTYEEEVEDDLDAFFDDLGDGAGELRVERPIARMKVQGRKGGDAVVQAAPARGFDFEDAVFLVPQEGMDVDAA